MAAKTRYILDTNVLLYDPNALQAYAGSEVIVPITVIEEIDQFKTEASETGRNARLVSQAVDELRMAGSLAEGITRPDGSIFRVQVWQDNGGDFRNGLDLRRSSNRVLVTALELSRQEGGKVVLVSQDTNLRIKANALGIEAVGYEGSRPLTTELYTGFQLRVVAANELEEYRKKERLAPEAEFFANQGLICQVGDDPAAARVFRFDEKAGELQAVRDFGDGIWGLHPRNPQQELALEVLLDPRISIVTLMGKAGTGKTLLALAAGLKMMLDENEFAKVLVSRPIFPMGRDIGYLPGTAEEKLEPWMQPIFDNLEFLIASPVSSRHPAKGYQSLLDQGLINIEPLTYIRGRSIPHQFMLVDEAQNLTPHEIKTIITRAGEGTKIVLTGDPYQIDNPYVDSISNGLSHVVERFKNHRLAAHVTLIRGERSSLAEMAANVL